MNPLFSLLSGPSGDSGPLSSFALVLLVFASIAFYYGLVFRVGLARTRYGIPAPAVTGHPDFERALRAQLNMGEQLAPYLGVLAASAIALGSDVASVFAFAWLLARVGYAVAYSRGSSWRSAWFGLSMAVVMGMMACV